jgi:hypothetical protein
MRTLKKLLEDTFIKSPFHKLAWDIPVGKAYVESSEGLIEVSKLSDKQFKKCFGCTRKEFNKLKEILKEETNDKK